MDTIASTSPLVWVIVLNGESWKDTLECLKTLEHLDYPTHDVLVVDNGSRDGSEAEIRRARPDCKLIQTGANLGYAGGNNAGARHALAAGAEYIWILNPDTRADRSSLSELIAPAVADLKWGALASRAICNGKQSNSAYSISGEPIRCQGCAAPGSYHPAHSLKGASLLLRSAALGEVGLFDESYFHYYEDRDLIERIRRAGWRVGMACRSVVGHRAGTSLPYRSPQSQYYLVRNRLLYHRKFLGEHPLRALWRHPRILIHVKTLRRALAFDFRPAIARLWGIMDAIRGKSGHRDLGSAYSRKPRSQ